MSGWISVEDRLPDIIENVITYREDSGLVTHATYLNGKFQLISTSGCFVELSGVVTHWMPLPDPPEAT